jgi:protein O-mannosyl-transferase
VKRQKHRQPAKPAARRDSSSQESRTSPSRSANGIPEFLQRWWSLGWLPGLILIVATVIAYHPAWHGGFIWDDDVYVTDNNLLSAPDGLKRIWFSQDSPSQYFPLTYTMLRMERTFWGLNTTGYHWVNLLLHMVNALLVWRLLQRLNVPGAWLAAAIFALHPVQVESVAWITEQKNVLSLFFYLLALLSWIEFIGERAGRLWRFYVLALIFCALALFSKTTACTLPAALLLILWLKGKPINRSRLAQLFPFFAMGAGMGLLTVFWERYHQGTQGKYFSLGLTERILVASHGVWFYMGKLIWPVNLTFIYPRWSINPADPLAYGWLVMGIGLCAAIYFVRRFVGRSVEVAVLFFVVTLSPVLGFIMLYTFQYTFVADHYQYVACIGLIALAAAGITKVFVGKPFFKFVFCGTLLLALGVLTWRQASAYQNIETLWRDTLAKNPQCWMAHNNLAYVLFKKGQVDEAITHLQKAFEIQPDSADAAYDHSNLGAALLEKGRLDEAIVQLQKSLEIQPENPDAQSNLGVAFLRKGRLDDAIAQFEKSLNLQPADVSTQNNLASALRRKGRVDEAIAHYRQALQIEPDSAETHYNLANALNQKGSVDEAAAHYRRALEIQPNFSAARRNLEDLLSRTQQVRESPPK